MFHILENIALNRIVYLVITMAFNNQFNYLPTSFTQQNDFNKASMQFADPFQNIQSYQLPHYEQQQAYFQNPVSLNKMEYVNSSHLPQQSLQFNELNSQALQNQQPLDSYKFAQLYPSMQMTNEQHQNILNQQLVSSNQVEKKKMLLLFS